MTRAASSKARANKLLPESDVKHFRPEASFYIRLNLADLKPPKKPTFIDARKYSDNVYVRALRIVEIAKLRSFGSINGFPVMGVPAIVLNGSEADILSILGSPDLKDSIEGIYPNDPIDVTA